MNFKKYQRKGLSEMIPFEDFQGFTSSISISEPDKKLRDENYEEFAKGFIARNPKNHEDMWYVAKKYHDENLEEMVEPRGETFFDRLVKERDELADKILKLESFLANQEKAIEISGHKQYEYLCLQKEHMAEYYGVLCERIEDIESKSEGV